MNSFRSILIVAAIQGGALLTHSQVAPAATPVQAAQPLHAAASDTRGQRALAEAKVLAKEGNFARAEEVLGQLNHFKRNTRQWHVESSRQLMKLARDLAKDNDSANVRATANRALTHLANAETKANDNKAKAGCKADAAYIQHRFLGDPQAALSGYQAALRLDPDNPAIKREAGRLERMEAHLRARIAPPKK